MKKILTLIGAISITGSGASTVISCGDNNNNNSNSKFQLFNLSSWGQNEKEKIKSNYLKTHKKIDGFTQQDAVNFLNIISSALVPSNLQAFSDLYIWGTYSNWIAVRAYSDDGTGSPSSTNGLGVTGECDVWI